MRVQCHHKLKWNNLKNQHIDAWLILAALDVVKLKEMIVEILVTITKCKSDFETKEHY